MRVGALTVYRPDKGCEVVTFGSPVSPSAVLFDGYLFDRESLAAELGLERQASQADIVVAGYGRWGDAVFERVEGRFLIGVWDARQRRLVVGRDGLNRHPVFYAVVSDAVWFSANVLALASSGRVSNRPDRLSLALGVLRYWPSAGHTYFEAINRLRPNHHLRVTPPNTVSEQRYSDPSGQEEPWLPEAEVVEAFEPALEQAVARCMRLGAHGVMLSGGVDSVTVAALAAGYTRAHGIPPITAVSGQSGEVPPNYEERMQSAAAKALGMRHVINTVPERLGGLDSVQLSLDSMHELPGPTVVSWIASYRRFYRFAADQGMDTLLTGSGGDDWLRVADGYAADLIRQGNLIELYRFLRTDLTIGTSSLRGSLYRLMWRHGLRLHIDAALGRLFPAWKLNYHRRRWERNLPRWVCPDPQLREALVQDLMDRRPAAPGRVGRMSHHYYRHALTSQLNPYIVQEFETGYHVESSSGVRLLSPYHDQRLVRFFRRISPGTLLHGNRYKGLLRPIVQKRLPELGLENQRKEYPRGEQERARRALQTSIDAAWLRTSLDNLMRLGILDERLLATDSGNRRHGQDTPYELSRRFFIMSAERWVTVHASL